MPGVFVGAGDGTQVLLLAQYNTSPAELSPLSPSFRVHVAQAGLDSPVSAFRVLGLQVCPPPGPVSLSSAALLRKAGF